MPEPVERVNNKMVSKRSVAELVSGAFYTMFASRTRCDWFWGQAWPEAGRKFTKTIIVHAISFISVLYYSGRSSFAQMGARDGCPGWAIDGRPGLVWLGSAIRPHNSVNIGGLCSM